MIEPWAMQLTQALAGYDDLGATADELALRVAWAHVALATDLEKRYSKECALTRSPSWSSPSLA